MLSPLQALSVGASGQPTLLTPALWLCRGCVPRFWHRSGDGMWPCPHPPPPHPLRPLPFSAIQRVSCPFPYSVSPTSHHCHPIPGVPEVRTGSEAVCRGLPPRVGPGRGCVRAHGCTGTGGDRMGWDRWDRTGLMGWDRDNDVTQDGTGGDGTRWQCMRQMGWDRMGQEDMDGTG